LNIFHNPGIFIAPAATSSSPINPENIDNRDHHPD